jgi:hypothetical protein
MQPGEVAMHLGISIPTVRSHMSVLYELIRNAWDLPKKHPLNFRDVQIRFGDYFISQVQA